MPLDEAAHYFFKEVTYDRATQPRNHSVVMVGEIMGNEDEVICSYYALDPAELPLLGRIEVQELLLPDNAPPQLMMEVELLRENPTHSRLLLSFGDVKQLQIRQPSLSLFQMSFINVTCIKDRQCDLSA